MQSPQEGGQGARGFGGKTKEEIKTQISGSSGCPPRRGRCGSKPGGKPGTTQRVTVLQGSASPRWL